MIQRSLDSELVKSAQQYPVVTVTGPRQSGKTTLVKHVFKDYKYLNLENLEIRRYAQEDAKGFFQEYSGNIILDEIQHVPELTSWIQVLVDEKPDMGRFILTGSQQFSLMEAVSQSLAGRTAIHELLPFSFTELSDKITWDTNRFICNGFYPRIYDQEIDPYRLHSDYVTTYIERDLRRINSVHNIQLFQKFLSLCAGRVGQLLNLSNLGNEVGISQTTAKEWLTILQTSYIVYLLPPYYENIGKRLIKTPKLYFYDVGLTSHLLGIENQSHLKNHPLRGQLFENLVISELVKYRYNVGKRSNLFFYRDSNGNEVDVISKAGFTLHSIEIKSSQTFHSTFLKGIHSFKKTFPSQTKEGQAFVLYDGELKQTRENTQILPASEIEELQAALQ